VWCELIKALDYCVQSSTSIIILPQYNVHGFVFSYRSKNSAVRTKTSIITTHSTTFQDFPGIYDQLSEVSKFQHHTKLCPTCSFSLFSSLNVSPICWWKELLVECCSCHGNLGFNLTCTSCIIRYQATLTVQIFHILWLFLILHIPYWRWSLDIYLSHIIPIALLRQTKYMFY